MEKLEVEAVVCDWCGKAEPASDPDTIQQFGDLHLCAETLPNRLNDIDQDDFGPHISEELEPERNPDLEEDPRTVRIKPSCYETALEYAVRCRRVGICDTNGEIKIVSCRLCGEKFNPQHPHVADGLCVHCAPSGRSCPSCHHPVDMDGLCANCAASVTL